MNNSRYTTILSKIDSLFDEFGQIAKESETTHPLLYSYWSAYLAKKRDSLMLLSTTLEKFVQTCSQNEVQDVTQEQLLLLYLLLRN